jgi:hypothetical protein
MSGVFLLLARLFAMLSALKSGDLYHTGRSRVFIISAHPAWRNSVLQFDIIFTVFVFIQA